MGDGVQRHVLRQIVDSPVPVLRELRSLRAHALLERTIRREYVAIVKLVRKQLRVMEGERITPGDFNDLCAEPAFLADLLARWPLGKPADRGALEAAQCGPVPGPGRP